MLKIPLKFITFAKVNAKMYKHFRNKDSFILQDNLRTYGNKFVYGGIFTLQDFDFYITNLDAYHACSMSALRRNHIKDLHHRVIISATPINFSTLEDLSRLKYTESEDLMVQTYFGNPNHKKITNKIKDTTNQYRILNGIDKINFKKMWRDVNE